MRTFVPVTLVALLLGGTALAQHHPGGHSPYAEISQRSIKALSEQQIADLRNGRGMGLALAAELNGYPGPLHVIEHADALDLSAAQRNRMEGLHAEMKAETVAIGLRLIEQEQDLDRLFASKTVTESALDEATARIGETQARLRGAHLKYHLSTRNILAPEQVETYNALRGYRAR
ncbi:Spy/CpxP family protein refolding chaperone [Microvirga roseola]|uniref:Spy/CpxP family protein refolding chaperone n=1 Tax=Microvirga roseola TaxID=2883126 RepID=UPI001E4D14C5|nr:periplasmic heavy metal sensor [Microvirga roseola]